MAASWLSMWAIHLCLPMEAMICVSFSRSSHRAAFLSAWVKYWSICAASSCRQTRGMARWNKERFLGGQNQHNFFRNIFFIFNYINVTNYIIFLIFNNGCGGVLMSRMMLEARGVGPLWSWGYRWLWGTWCDCWKSHSGSSAPTLKIKSFCNTPNSVFLTVLNNQASFIYFFSFYRSGDFLWFPLSFTLFSFTSYSILGSASPRTKIWFGHNSLHYLSHLFYHLLFLTEP